MRKYFRAIIVALAISPFSLVAKTSWNNPSKSAERFVQHESFRSASLKTEVGYNICLPEEYNGKADQRFPVIYYLHGYEGNESSFLDYAKYWRDAVKRLGPA